MAGLSGFSLAMFALGSVMSGAAVALSKKLEWDREKGSPFECGFDPRTNSRLAFSLRFFLIAVVFLVFDVEIALLLPLAVSEGSSGLSVWGSLGSTFLVILLAGAFHEWRQGALDWKL